MSAEEICQIELGGGALLHAYRGAVKQSWADAARNGVMVASRTLRDLRVAEVDRLDLKIEGGEVIYRAKLNVSFKYHGNE